MKPKITYKHKVLEGNQIKFPTGQYFIVKDVLCVLSVKQTDTLQMIAASSGKIVGKPLGVRKWTNQNTTHSDIDTMVGVGTWEPVEVEITTKPYKP